MPVPSYQVVEFLEWMSRRELRIDPSKINREELHRFAIEYIQRGMRHEDRYELEYYLQVFQSCPMVTEPTITEQIDHFSGCGACLEYIRREGGGKLTLSLHPLLRDFLRYSEQTGFKKWVFNTLRQSIQFDRSNREDDWFRFAIREIGSKLRESFHNFIVEVPSTLIQDYEIFRRTCNTRDSGNKKRGRFERNRHDENAHPINQDDNPQESARRLVASVEELMQGGFYDNIIASNHQLCKFLSVITDFPEDLAQSLEFLTWIWEEQPKLNITGDIPSEKLIELTQTFCEVKGYSNAASFSKTVGKWIKGESSSSIVNRLRNFIWRNAPSNRNKRRE